MVIYITLLAGIHPHLQVTFIALLEGFLSELLVVKDRATTIGSSPLILYHVVSDFWVDHGEVVLIDLI